MFREIIQRLLPETPPETLTHVAIVRSDSANHRIWGWAYITRDKDGVQVEDSKKATLPTEVLEEGVYEFNRRESRPHADMHAREEDGATVIQTGWIVESMVFTREKCDALGIPPGIVPEGWWICAEVPEDSECWRAVQRGERADFSIAGIAISEYA